METVKGIAWWAIFGIGFFVLGTLGVVVGGVWTIVWLAWMGFWIVVAILVSLGEPGDYS